MLLIAILVPLKLLRVWASTGRDKIFIMARSTTVRKEAGNVTLDDFVRDEQ